MTIFELITELSLLSEKHGLSTEVQYWDPDRGYIPVNEVRYSEMRGIVALDN